MTYDKNLLLNMSESPFNTYKIKILSDNKALCLGLIGSVLSFLVVHKDALYNQWHLRFVEIWSLLIPGGRI